MITIKRYSNRKLYDTQAGRYITIEEIGQAVRQGEDLRVVDHASGADLTTLTLLQVILEEERKAQGWLPHQLLARLLRAGQAHIGALLELVSSQPGFRDMLDSDIRRRVEQLVEHDRLTDTEASRLLEMLLDPELTKIEQPISAPLPAATSADVQMLLAEVERLTAVVDDMLG